MNILLKLYKLSEKFKKTVISIWLSYLAGISIEYITNANSLTDLLNNVFDFSKVSVCLLWSGLVIVAVTWTFNLVFDKIRVSNKVEIQFSKVMKQHTFDALNVSELTSYSWGYDKAICVPNNSSGGNPRTFILI